MFLLTIMICLGLSGIANAEIDLDTIMDNLNHLEGQSIPSPVNKFVKSEQINVHVFTSTGAEEVIGINILEGKVDSVTEETLPDPNLDLYLTEELLIDLTTGSNPLTTMKEAYNNGDLSYQAHGLWGKIKYLLVKSALKLDFLIDENVPPVIDESEVVEEVVEEVEDAVEEVIEEVEEEIEEVVEEVTEEEATEEVTEEVTEEEPAETETTEETTEEETEAEAEEVEEEIVEETTTLHTVEITEDGFEPNQLTISVGDTVEWVNVRVSNTLNKAMVIGTQKCSEAQSDIFETDETFEWTFSEAERCIFVDGITTTQIVTITIEE